MQKKEHHAVFFKMCIQALHFQTKGVIIYDSI